MSVILDALKKAQAAQKDLESQNDPLEKARSPVAMADEDSSAETGESNFDQFEMPPVRTKTNSKKKILVLALATIFIGVLIGFLTMSGSLPLLGGTSDTPSEETMQKQAAEMKEQQEALAQKKQEEEAKKNEEKIRKLEEKARERYFQGKYYEAAAYYKELTDIKPDNFEAFNNLGVAYRKAGKMKDAKIAYLNAVEINPQYAEALNNLAVVEIAEKRFDLALERLLKAVETSPEYIEPYLHIAICYEKLNDLPKSATYYRMFLDRSAGKMQRKLRLHVENRLMAILERIK